MKIVKTTAPKPITITVRMPPGLLARVDAARDKADLSREPFIRAVLEQVLSDPKFVLRVKE